MSDSSSDSDGYVGAVRAIVRLRSRGCRVFNEKCSHCITLILDEDISNSHIIKRVMYKVKQDVTVVVNSFILNQESFDVIPYLADVLPHYLLERDSDMMFDGSYYTSTINYKESAVMRKAREEDEKWFHSNLHDKNNWDRDGEADIFLDTEVSDDEEIEKIDVDELHNIINDAEEDCPSSFKQEMLAEMQAMDKQRSGIHAPSINCKNCPLVNLLSHIEPLPHKSKNGCAKFYPIHQHILKKSKPAYEHFKTHVAEGIVKEGRKGPEFDRVKGVIVYEFAPKSAKSAKSAKKAGKEKATVYDEHDGEYLEMSDSDSDTKIKLYF